jgi:hypothetical protein
MKSETEIRAEITTLEAIADEVRRSGGKPYPVLGALSALRWVIGDPLGWRMVAGDNLHREGAGQASH